MLDAHGNVMLASSGAAIHDVPLFLEEAKDTILMTGKYLNAIRECGRPVERPLPVDVHIGELLPFMSCLHLGCCSLASCWCQCAKPAEW